LHNKIPYLLIFGFINVLLAKDWLKTNGLTKSLKEVLYSKWELMNPLCRRDISTPTMGHLNDYFSRLACTKTKVSYFNSLWKIIIEK